MRTPVSQMPRSNQDGIALARMPRAERKTGAALIYEELYKSIAHVELKPGEVLNEKALTERFSVSRTPLREALLRLQGDGLVEMVPQAGTFVSRISVAAIREAIIIRRALEELAVERLAEVANERDVARIDLLRRALADKGLSFAGSAPEKGSAP